VGAEVAEHQRDGDAEGEEVGDGLTDLDARQAPDSWEKQNQGYEEETVSAGREKIRGGGAAAGLERHVADCDQRGDRVGEYLPAEGDGADGNDLRVVPEDVDDAFREDEAEDADGEEEGEPRLAAEPVAFLHAVMETRTEAESAQRLEALADADSDGEDDEGDARDDRHSGDGGIAVLSRSEVQHDSRDAGEALSRQRRSAAFDDVPKNLFVKAYLIEMQSDSTTEVSHRIKYGEACDLTDDGTYRRSRNT